MIRRVTDFVCERGIDKVGLMTDNKYDVYVQVGLLSEKGDAVSPHSQHYPADREHFLQAGRVIVTLPVKNKW